ncbi:erythromycin esterase family protein [halophilic archaeon]|nr:erythromycin esterase family protein [halophilic archaeon]
MSATGNRTLRRVEGVEDAADAVGERAYYPARSAELDRLVEAVGDSQYVLLGEASHGTSEFYRWRAQLTAHLVAECGFSFVAVEGDWTDCYDVNRYVRGASDADHAVDVLAGFDRWPTWMWANWEVAEFVEWLRAYNDENDADAGFYGLDVYSLFESMRAVLDYLERERPEALDAARDAVQCFEPYGEDAREYGRSTGMVPDTCEDEVVDLLAELGRLSDLDGGDDAPDARFNAEQNALVAKNAEEYYRTMVRSSSESWNVRDEHMVETLDRLVDHRGPDAKAVVWAHNTHVGDARATDMTDRGRVNVGQLVRERHPGEVSVVGFGTHRGSVVAADSWGADRERMRLPPAREGSVGDVFHRGAGADALLFTEDVADAFADPRGHRAVGVVYHPDRELGNYVPTVLPERYDAVVHVEETTALHPLPTEPNRSETPEAYPWGI